MKKSIKAKVVADSINEQGDRITSFLLTFPRMILAELNTHRVFTRNSASSRAIPFNKMLKSVQEDPFRPIAWQKDHAGMQGTEYLDPAKEYSLSDFFEVLESMFENLDGGVADLKVILDEYGHIEQTLSQWWLLAKNLAVKSAVFLYAFGVTKQLCNRLLEPFMWHTVLVTSTEFENFFNLRCPKYECLGNTYSSLKDAAASIGEGESSIIYENPSLAYIDHADGLNTVENHSQAEIHIQALAESMWDAMNDSNPQELNPNEYHIPFGDDIRFPYSFSSWHSEEKHRIKVAAARCARLSYMTFDNEIDYEKDIQLHDRLLKSGHMSPFEHIAKCMDSSEYSTFIKGKCETNPISESVIAPVTAEGWCNNFKGWLQYRYLLEN